jgi:hypothetical protein
LLLQAVSQAIKYLAIVVGHEEVLKVIREDEQPEVQAVLEEIAERAKQH